MRNDVTNTARALAIKGAFKRLVDLCGGLEMAAVSTRCSSQMLSFYGHPNTDVHPPCDVVADLEQVCGVPEVTRVMALLAGQGLVPVLAGDPGAATCAAMVRDLLQKSGPFSADMLDALADGQISDRERAALTGPARDLMICVFGLAHSLGVVK